jgi:hypothetical protein
MTKKQLRSLISAGVFSAALLSGAAYAEDAKVATPTPEGASPSAPPGSADTSQAKDDVSQSTSTPKGFLQHGCAGAGGCGGGK